MPEVQDVKSAIRVVQIFELFSEINEPLNLTSISKRLSFPKSSCLALLKTLEGQGYIYKIGDEAGYYPTSKILNVAEKISKNDAFLSVVRPYMERLVAVTGETVFLAQRDGVMSHYIEVIESEQALRFAAKVGEKRDIYIGAAGLCLLSSMKDDDLKLIINELHFESYAEATVSTSSEIYGKIIDGRRKNRYLSVDGYQKGISSIGNILNINNKKYALVVAAPTQRILNNDESIAASINKTIGDIESNHKI